MTQQVIIIIKMQSSKHKASQYSNRGFCMLPIGLYSRVKVEVSNVALSNHDCVFFKMSLSTETCTTENKRWSKNNSSMKTLVHCSVNALVSSFTSRVINKSDPMKAKVMSGKKRYLGEMPQVLKLTDAFLGNQSAGALNLNSKFITRLIKRAFNSHFYLKLSTQEQCMHFI